MGKRVLAFDFGASSGRAMLGEFDGEKISLQEIHRFSNDPVMLSGTFYWDILRLFHEIKVGITKAKLSGGFDSIGINTWGVDFGLLDKDGRLLENPVNYRDKRTEGLLKYSEKFISNKELYLKTGNQLMEINTAFQLLSLKKNRPQLLENASKLLMTPDLFGYLLTGKMVAEMSIASTTQLVDPVTKEWNFEVIKTLGLPKEIFPKIVQSGTVIGKLTPEIAEELGVEQVPVVAVCGHDTQDAVMATPSENEDFIFLSCGTWSLFGTEIAQPILNDTSFELNLTNEIGFDGKINLLNNIIGLWLIQESKHQWAREGKEYTFADLEKMALESEEFLSFINPDYPDFTPSGNIPRRIKEYCEKTNQPVPKNDGEVMRCIYQSLAMKYRYSLELIEKTTGKKYEKIHIVGGGIRDKLLCQLCADMCQRQVVAGPVEATVLGNVAIQLMAHGEISDLQKAREIIRNSENFQSYLPQNLGDNLTTAYNKFMEIMLEREPKLK